MANKKDISFRSTFIIHTRRQLLRSFTQTTIPNLRVLHTGWPKKIFTTAAKKLKKIHMIWKNKRYTYSQHLRHKKQLKLQILAEYLFKDKKCNYECNTQMFLNERLNSFEKYLKMSFMRTLNEKYVYGIKVVKFDRKGYRRRSRILILTNKSFYLNKILNNKLKPKEKIPLDFINKLEVTSGQDNFLLIKISPQYNHNKGDIILEVPYLIEFVTKFINISQNYKLLNIIELSCVNQRLLHNIKGSKSGVIELKKNNSTPSITKGKNKNLIVCG